MVSLINRLIEQAVALKAWTNENREISSDKVHDAVLAHSIYSPYSRICFYEVRQGLDGRRLEILFGCLLPGDHLITRPINQVYQAIIYPLNDRAVKIDREIFECSTLQELVNKCLLNLPKMDRFYASWNFSGYKIIPMGQLTTCLTENQKKWFSLVDKCKCCRSKMNDKIMDTVLLQCDHMVHRRCITKLSHCPECTQEIARDAEALWNKRFNTEISQMAEVAPKTSISN